MAKHVQAPKAEVKSQNPTLNYILVGHMLALSRLHPTFSSSTYISFCEEQAAYSRQTLIPLDLRWG